MRGAYSILLEQPPVGWAIEHAAQARFAATALAAGETFRLQVEAGPVPSWLDKIEGIVLNGAAARTILISDRANAPADLVYRPKTIVLGIGCESLASADEVAALADRCLAEAGIAALSIACIATIMSKATAPAIQALSRNLGVPIRAFSAAQLEAEASRLVNPSEIVFRATGCHGVAEGGALAGVGADGRLILPKQRGSRVTCALARSAGIVDPTAIGQDADADRGDGQKDITGGKR